MTVTLKGPQNNGSMPSSQQASESTETALLSFFKPGTGMDFAFLSPEALIQYVETQLEKTDSKIASQMQDLQDRRDAADALAGVAGMLKQAKTEGTAFWDTLKTEAFGHAVLKVKDKFGNQSEFDSGHTYTPAGIEKAKQEAAALGFTVESVSQKGGDPQKAAEYQSQIDKFKQAAAAAKAAGYPDIADEINAMADSLEQGNPPSAGTIDKCLSDLEQATSSLSSSCEITQIRMQELIQERSRTVMFVTNTLASLNDAAKKIIENTR